MNVYHRLYCNIVLVFLVLDPLEGSPKGISHLIFD